MKTPVKNRILAFFVLSALVLLIVAGLRWTRARDYKRFARELTGINPEAPSIHSIEELSAAAQKYEHALKEHSYLAEQTGLYWKFLGMRYAEKGMHQLALEAFEKTRAYYPMDSSLFYLASISAGNIAKSTLDLSGKLTDLEVQAERGRYLALAESMALRAIEINADYAQARYALAILYAFEMDRPADALKQIDAFLAKRSKDVDALFVRARALYMLARYSDAMEVYENIMAISRSPQKRAEAETNYRFILEGGSER